ncbi:RagB/SusD family nutrient uptake outer membrane protein [Niabella pedocola]|uniref:RagB/SusD family nutrient uptake outer membrane protein n=1 Tax=Niabella pedocola TaxID=1752077 RepID=A0ABS8PTJ0_9BACT|nr:RagB/SusD family nutrient uptake outer membrane protein [Niabella pedocola]MCD2424392.1 RagB/SusD family nutrient uptake outer membrane protein [Niabella pedocola]
MKKNLKYLGLLSLLLALISCQKFLDAKPDQSLVIPSSLQDFQALLDDYIRVNQNDASAGLRSSDDYYLTYESWQAIAAPEDRNMYIWGKDNLFDKNNNNDWSYTFDNIQRANIILEGMNKTEQPEVNAADWNDVKGQAHFQRARNFLQAAFIWTQAYDPATASTDLGLPLRLTPDFNTPSVRSSVEQTYQQIIADFKKAAQLLPVSAVHKLRPGKAAAFAFLARTYLSMRKYDQAVLYADSSLQLNDTLLDYNKVKASASFPFAPRFSNPEDLFNANMTLPESLSPAKAKIDTVLLGMYTDNDLRRGVFFGKNADSGYRFKGSYIGAQSLYSGIATDEVYLIKSECLVRTGLVQEGISILNQLLLRRWKTGTYLPYTTTDPTEALALVLKERRKELLMRGLRWMDIKRFNKESTGIQLTRTLGTSSYSLLPNDLRCALPIPEDVIAITGMPQNPR